MISIYNYTNYRLFLKDYCENRKKENKNFSHAYVVGKIGFKSAVFFTQIINGTSNISMKLIYDFSKSLKLKDKEAEYFELIVNYTQAKTQKEKKHFFERIYGFTDVSFKKLRINQYDFYQKWYYVAIRDILSIFEFKEDYQKLARLLEPTISIPQARKAIVTLEKLNMIKRNKKGIWEVTNQLISSSYSERHSIALAKYAVQMFDIAKNAVNNLLKSERSISWVGVSISRETFDIVQDEIKTFRKRILSIIKADKKPDRVYHFSIQCFPLSKRLDTQKYKGTNK